ncbi:hypothetical protein [Microvirga sp. G4-2]|uniref:hypothetical protein n=1 Tax=Microvirga sp. G4-2 TaxID=3434467 RepID=UPI00404456A3
MRKIAVMVLAAVAAVGISLSAEASSQQAKEWLMARGGTCKAVSTCEEAVELWCGGYSRRTVMVTAFHARTSAGRSLRWMRSNKGLAADRQRRPISATAPNLGRGQAEANGVNDGWQTL